MTRFIQPTFQQMRLFEAVARLGSVTRAAQEVNLTQPTVSMQIKALEDKVGAALTEQVGKKIHLTREGEEVARSCRDVLERMEDMRRALEDMRREVEGPLSIVAVSTAKYFLPQLLGQFKRRYPRVEPRLHILNREQLLQRSETHPDDLYIMGRAVEGDMLQGEPFLENLIAFVAHPDHPLVGRAHIPLEEIAAEAIIGRELGSGTRTAVAAQFEQHALPFEAHMEFDGSEAIKQAVMSGLGIAYLSLHAIRLERLAGEVAVLDVTGFPLRRQWYVAHRQGRHLSNAARGFLGFLKDEAGEYRTTM